MASPEENWKRIGAMCLECYDDPEAMFYNVLLALAKHHSEINAAAGRDPERSFTLSLINHAIDVYHTERWD